MTKKWKSYHGADGECTYTDAWFKCVGLIELGHPPTFTISEIIAQPNQLNPDRLLCLLAITVKEFRDCVVRVSFSDQLLSLFESLQAEGKLKFERQRSQYSDRFKIIEISAPDTEPLPKESETLPSKSKRWKLW